MQFARFHEKEARSDVLHKIVRISLQMVVFVVTHTAKLGCPLICDGTDGIGNWASYQEG